jgi:catalase
MASPDYTTSYGSPVNYPHAAQRVSVDGPLILQGRIILYPICTSGYSRHTDFHHIDILAHLGRERIPERIVRIIHIHWHFTRTPTPKHVGPCQGCWRSRLF